MPIDAPLILVDGSSYIYRAFHALPPLVNSKSQPTGAVKGVTSMLLRLQKDYPQSCITVVFDAKGRTFRDEIYPQYKANRPPMPNDLRPQIEPIHRIVEALGFPLLVVPGVEADDVIGSLAVEASQSARQVVISTGDKDMAQLVSDHITLVNTMDQTSLDSAGVSEKFGIPPKYIIDYLALMGDKSDNIPGVAGVGKKTAMSLIQGLGGLTEIYGNLDKIAALNFRGSKTIADKLRAHEDLALLSYELATIKTDVKLPVHALELAHQDVEMEVLKTLFEELEFSTLLKELNKAMPDSTDPQITTADYRAQSAAQTTLVSAISDPLSTDYQLITEAGQLDKWIEKIKESTLVAVDTETTSLDYMNARLVGISLAVSPGEAVYIPFGHDYLGVPEQLPMEHVLAQLKPSLEDPLLMKVGQNLKYDMSVLSLHGINLQGIAYDTMLQSYVLNSVATRHDLDSLSQRYLDIKPIKFEDIAGKGRAQLSFNQISLEQAAPYASEDADLTLRLHNRFWPAIQESPKLTGLFREMEMPLISVLSQIERNGAMVDSQLLFRHGEEIASRLTELEENAFELAGERFNLASPKQLAYVLFEKLGIPPRKKTSKGAHSTREEVLQDLALDYPLPKLLLEHRSLAKLKSTYTDKLPSMVDSKSGRVHTSYHQAGTATGRLSSSNPNLQNIPIKTTEGRRIREAFVAPSGCKILAADYSQIELRIMAHLSKDETLMTSFIEGLDVHCTTAAEVFDVTPEQITAQQRRSAKAINFGLIYGMSAFGLSKQLSITFNEARNYIGRYFERYPGVQHYMETVRQRAARQGFVETVFGRRLYLPDITVANSARRQAAERTAINAPMQGTAADIIKMAMISTDRWLRSEKLSTRMIMQVHDELVLEVPEHELEIVELGLKRCMETAASLDIPLVVDIGVGTNWNEAH